MAQAHLLERGWVRLPLRSLERLPLLALLVTTATTTDAVLLCAVRAEVRHIRVAVLCLLVAVRVLTRMRREGLACQHWATEVVANLALLCADAAPLLVIELVAGEPTLTSLVALLHGPCAHVDAVQVEWHLHVVVNYPCLALDAGLFRLLFFSHHQSPIK